MKYKKYLLILIIAISFGIQKTYALENNKKTTDIQFEINNINTSKFAIIADDIDCDGIFGDPNDAGEYDANGKIIRSPSIAYLVNYVLKYVRIIVPMIIIVLGMLDLGKAVVSGNEDQMRKAQKTFVMRIIAGIAVFFAPVVVNAVMWLADKVGQDPGCAGVIK